MAISKRRHRHRGSQLQLLLVAVFLIPVFATIVALVALIVHH